MTFDVSGVEPALTVSAESEQLKRFASLQRVFPYGRPLPSASLQ